MTTAFVRPCNCVNEYQDAKYGKGMRVHNETRQANPVSQRYVRCTVCGKEKIRGGEVA